jgi:filamentous hemagglutinin family protein
MSGCFSPSIHPSTLHLFFMSQVASKNRGENLRPWKVASAVSISLLMIAGQTQPAIGNPTGGAVVAGSANIGGAGKTLTINQSSHNAIINWQQFSIASGELTKFLVPNSSSATLNRVVGGNASAIYGTLQSNGQLFLINSSGILVGPHGQIDTAGFIGSTLDVSNAEFLAGGNMHFVGGSTASIENQGNIDSQSGSVYLLANNVSNSGSIAAQQGNVGLAAASDVLFQQAGDQHLFVQATPSGTTRAMAVNNSGTVRAASAELRATGGNAYALAINNSGSIAATGYKKINGEVYLTSDVGTTSNSGTIRVSTANQQGGLIHLASTSGNVINSGTLNVSATAMGGQGGAITLKSGHGLAANTTAGQIDARGGQNGKGGQVEVSGTTVQAAGLVDTRSLDGLVGMFTIDPATFTVAATGGNETGAQVASTLATTDLTLNADDSVTINQGISWTSNHTLTLSTNTMGSTIAINAAISGVNGGLTLSNNSGGNLVTASGAVNVATFILDNGSWTQNNSTLPAFTASHSFDLLGSSTFLRVTGGNGTSSPYQIVDVYGLQGLGSPSESLLGANAVLMNNINATGTASWNGGEGFSPIGTYDGYNSGDGNTYRGVFNGQGYTINGIYINTPNASYAGLFGDTGSSTLENVNLTNVNVTGGDYVGGLTGVCNSTVTNVSSSGTVTGTVYVGGLFGITSGAISASTSSGSVIGTNDAIGGLVGYTQFGSIATSDSSANVTGEGSVDEIGGLVGLNGGTITRSYSSGSVSSSSGDYVGGLVGYNENNISYAYSTGMVSGSNVVGGLVGETDSGTISDAYSTGAVSGSGSGIGGLLGASAGGSIADSFYSTNGSGQSTGIGQNSGTTITYNGNAATSITGLTLAQMKLASSYPSSYDFGTVYTTNGNTTTPQLIGVGSAPPSNQTGGGTDVLSGIAFTDNGLTDASGVTIDLVFDGSVIATATSSGSGTFSFNVSASDLTGGILLTDATNNGDTYYQAGTPSSTIGGIDIWGSTLRVTADTASNAALGQAAGNLGGIDYAVSGANLSTNSGVNMNILTGYTLDGNVTASGALSTGANASLTGSHNVTLTGSSVTLAGTFDLSGALSVVSTTGSIGLDGVGALNSPAMAHSLTLSSAETLDIVNSNLALTGGNFTATGVGFASTTSGAPALVGGVGDSDGIDIFSSLIQGGSGTITLHGTAGYFYDSSQSVLGVAAGTGVNIGSSTLATTGAGSISITGDGEIPSSITSLTGLQGVAIDNLLQSGGTGIASTLSVQSGSLAIVGTVNQGNAGNDSASTGIKALVIDGGSQITASGGGGSVSLTGNSSGSTALDSSNGGGSNAGVQIGDSDDSSTLVSVATDGHLTIHGTGGALNISSGSSLASDGVIITPGATVNGGTGSAVSITGTSGTVTSTGALAGRSNGIATGGDAGVASTITVADGGSLTLTGFGGTVDTSQASAPSTNDNPGAQGVQLATGTMITATGNASIAVTGTGGTMVGTGATGSATGIAVGADINTGATDIQSDSGNIIMTGVGGTSPRLADGVLLHGTNGGAVLVGSLSGDVRLIGTGGSGYTGDDTVTGTEVPNFGTAIVDNVTLVTNTGAVNLTGRGGANSYGVALLEASNAPSLDSAPVVPLIESGGPLTAVSLSNGLYLNASVLGGSAPITMQESGGNLVLGPDAELTNAGAGNNITLAAGTPTSSAGYIINNSTLGAAVIQVSMGAHYYLYSTSPVNDSLGGITAPSGNTFYSATYPSTPANISGDGAILYYVAGSGSTIPPVPPTPPTPPAPPVPGTTPTDIASVGDGSNVIPPAAVPQTSDVVPLEPTLAAIGNGSQPAPLSFNGNGTASQSSGAEGGLADSSGNGGQVASGDAAQLNSGQLNNVSSAAASGALNMALGPAVHTELLNALTTLGDWSGVADTGDDTATAGSGDQETTLSGGDVVEITGNGDVKSIPLSAAPKSLQNAMGNGVLNGLPGNGH